MQQTVKTTRELKPENRSVSKESGSSRYLHQRDALM
jgi:hypothetical protein